MAFSPCVRINPSAQTALTASSVVRNGVSSFLRVLMCALILTANDDVKTVKKIECVRAGKEKGLIQWLWIGFKQLRSFPFRRLIALLRSLLVAPIDCARAEFL
jgi:hypothetical protein